MALNYQDLLNGNTLFGTEAPQGVMGVDVPAANRDAMMMLATQLLAGSGPQPHRTTLGQQLGVGLQQAMAVRAQALQDQQKQRLVQAQIEALSAKADPNLSKLQQEYEYARSQGYAGTIEDWKRVASIEAKDPASIQEYNLAREQGYQGTLQDWLQQRSQLMVGAPYQLGEVGGARGAFSRVTGGFNPQSTPAEEAAAAGQRAGAEAAAKTTETATAEARIDLPRQEANAEQSIETIRKLKTHPGLQYIVGANSLLPIVPGTSQAGADALAKQIQGKTFLEAFNSLKGGGHITEIEGTKAEAAIGRLQRAQNRREYIQALNELEKVMSDGLARSRKKAGSVETEGNVIDFEDLG